jgi:tRNA(Ile)-lysidine synthase
MAPSGRLTGPAGQVVTALAGLPPGPQVVALSGGADSAAALWGAVEAARQVRAVHVDHHRAASPVLRAAAEAIARKLEVTLEVVEVDVPPGPSFEGQARRVRREALARNLGTGEWLVLGHTRDDQAETVLMNLLRGSGLDGLAGMRRRRPPIARPLLGLARSDTRLVATAAGLAWRDDPANADQRHLRNRLRVELVPLLEARYQPGLQPNLARLADIVAGEVDLLDELSTAIPVEESATGRRVAVGALDAARPAVAARVLRRLVAELGDGYPPTATQLARVLELASAPAGEAPVTGGITARRQGPWLVLERPPAPEVAPPAPLAVPGETRWGRFLFEVVVGGRPDVIPLSPATYVAPVSGEPLVRAAAPGDRVVVAGGTKPVVEVVAEAGVAPRRRGGWPVVEIEGRIVWIPGVRRTGWAGAEARRYLWAVAREDDWWDASAP